ncbi:cysteine-tryptophan domain-containing zinc finger protein 3-like isoform X1 [Coffea arabica]|uniref:Cysteine-tryptophan domain-containing zinc finger protein 3-like isoform X1 n=2 Tax=Coffea arabica TaxID=13443 RepID=A0A6P6WQU8_COFAR
MISVRGENGRKEIGLGFGRGNMEETELEEGEASLDSSIDPDIALSYLDEKVQDVLGHFQKDFEGGVSAENLGAKFGGYGSFLPTYQRSPSWSHAKTPPEVYNHNKQIFPNNMQLEDARQNSFSAPTASFSARPGTTSSSRPEPRAPSGTDEAIQDVSMLSNIVDDLASKVELEKSTNFSDGKALKFRIKVGIDNLSTRKNAEIYSGLGLDVSPSSSLEDSPMDSEGLLCHDLRDIPYESPTSILQIMTSVGLFGGLLLSPISNDVNRLTEKGWLCGDSKPKIIQKANLGGSRLARSGSDLAMTNGKVHGEKKPKLVEKSGVSVDLSTNNCKDTLDGVGITLKKETDVDHSSYEDLVSNALKLPLLSNACVADAKEVVKSVTVSTTVPKSSVKYDNQSNVGEEELLEPVAQNCRVEKSNRKLSLSEKVRESSKPTYTDEKSVHQKKEVNHKEDKAEFSIKIESNVSGERKYPKVDDSSNHNVDQKVASHNEYDLKSNTGELQSSSGGKKKSKGNQSQCTQGTDPVEDGLTSNSSMVPKSKKTSNSDIHLSKNDSEGLRKGYGKATDKYKDFFGDLELGQEDEEIASEEVPSVQMVKDSVLVEKRSMSESNIVNERPNCKKVEGTSVTGNHPKSSSYRPLPAGKGLNHDAATTMVAPLVKEDWVCCDKCQTWRLLPLGTNPESLPEKWLCSMLDWLPHMNHCSISEEETTNALRALYQVQASVAPFAAASSSQLNQHAHPGRTVLGVSPVDMRRSNEDCHFSGLQAMAAGGKKCGSKEVTSANSQDGPIQSSNLKKNLLACSNSRNLNEVDISPLFDEFGSQCMGQAGRSVVGRYVKEKEKKILLDSNSGEGDGTKSKLKNPRESDIDGLRASKKIKTEDVRNRDENCTSDHGVTSSKAGQSSSSASLNDPYKYSNYSRDSKGDPKRKWSSEKSEVQSLKMDKSGHDNFMKKKKGNGHLNAEVDCLPLPSSQHHSQGSKGFSDDTGENDRRKEKKARVSKSEGKDSRGNKDVTSERKARGLTDQKMEQDLDRAPSQRSIDAADSFRRDLGSGQPSVAATSSSSKVSGSHKSRTNHQEMKGSPVESVSSSPLRISNSDKLPQVRTVAGKEDLQDAGFFAEASPRRSLDGEDVGLSEQSLKVKDDTPSVIHHRSLESTVNDLQGRDLDDVASLVDKAEVVSSTGFVAHYASESKVNAQGQRSYASRTKTSEVIQDEGKRNYDQYASNVPHSKKSGKGSSSRSKEKIWSSISEFENGNESSYEEKLKAGRNRSQEKSSISSDRTESHVVSKKDSDGKTVRDTSRIDNPQKVGSRNGSIVRPDVVGSQDLKQTVAQDNDNDRSSRKLISDKAGVEVSGRGKSHSLPPSMRGQVDTLARPKPIAESQKEVGENKELDVIHRALKQSKNAEKQNGSHPVNLRHPTPPTYNTRDLDTSSPVRRDSSSQAVTNAVKEAKDLKHLADRLKNSGSTESTGLYFQAALKFLHGASLLESSNSENTKHNEMIQSMQMYSSTAKLCEFCAHEYEKSKDMAAAALAYKCMEVAYMRVIYTSHNSASRDRNELQAALQILPTGESPSSSASDIDNLNNPVNVDKAVQAKGVGSPQVAGNHVFTARNRSSFMRLINYAQDVNNAMEASRKSRNAFAAANPKLDGPRHKEGISSVKTALDFNFQDVDGLLRLVRVAMEAINR